MAGSRAATYPCKVDGSGCQSRQHLSITPPTPPEGLPIQAGPQETWDDNHAYVAYPLCLCLECQRMDLGGYARQATREKVPLHAKTERHRSSARRRPGPKTQMREIRHPRHPVHLDGPVKPVVQINPASKQAGRWRSPRSNCWTRGPSPAGPPPASTRSRSR